MNLGQNYDGDYFSSDPRTKGVTDYFKMTVELIKADDFVVRF